MPKGFFNVPIPVNEPVLTYAPGTPERVSIKEALKEAKREQRDIPMYIGGDRVRTENKITINPPHDHQYILGHFHIGDKGHVEQAIKAALAAKPAWENLSWEHRASIFLKAAELLAGPVKNHLSSRNRCGM